ncbi:MAG: glycosyltransferase [Bdellovibrionales bacterium]|nr:glycosyltransferase [Bdellovibrionales bacterium]
MTIVQIVRSPAGGIRKHVMDVIQHFVARGDRVILVADLSSGDETFKKQVNEDWFKDVKVIHLSIHRSPHPSDLKNLWKLFKILKPMKPEIIHGHGAKGGMYARILGGAKKSVYSPHGGSLHANYGALKNYLYQLVEKLLLPFTGRVVVESQYTNKQFKKLISEGFQRVSINYNGIAFPHERPQKKPLKYRVAALGLLRELKGFDLLIRAAEELSVEYPDLKVKISGEGEERESLQQLITKLHLEEVVELTGEVESPLQTYEWADVVVVPSRFESFGLVALEAMAQGVPVIVSYTGGLMELVEHGETGRIFTRDSSSDLAEVLRTTFQHWELTQKYAEKAFEVAKSKYTMEHMLLGLEKTYSLLTKR